MNRGKVQGTSLGGEDILGAAHMTVVLIGSQEESHQEAGGSYKVRIPGGPSKRKVAKNIIRGPGLNSSGKVGEYSER